MTAGGRDICFVFRPAAGQDIGFGHLNRCLILAKVAREMDAAAKFLLADQKDPYRSLVADHGFAYIERREIEGWTGAAPPGRRSIFVSDFVHRLSLQTPEALGRELQSYRPHFGCTAAIDGGGAQSARARLGNVAADVVIAPYVGEKPRPGRTRAQEWLGPEYFVLDPSYDRAGERGQREIAGRVLVTCGGADPKGVTLKVLRALTQTERRLEVRAVIGPYFAPDLRVAAIAAAANSPHRVACVEAPETLAPHMGWCDVAVSLSGLTKYELAATGTPAILLSLDAGDAETNVPFAACGCAADLGAVDSVSGEDLAEAIVSLLDDLARRRAMAANGRAMIDGRGAERIITKLRELLDAKIRISH